LGAEVKAKLDLNREEFIFDSLIGMPTTVAPKGFVVGKAMKAEALRSLKDRAPKESTVSKTTKTEPPKPKPKPKKPES
jgi:hypothetical protein